jgi:hypothetical protein
MHRVYNSAFMNMLKNEENGKYRATIKNTLEFDPEILKRFVNFMNNPDEETAVAQFGKGDKYFGICTLLVTMPGLPMFGHGQIEGFEEKYGMEYRRSYRDERPDGYLVDRHEREIFPLMKKRHLFSGSAAFRLYDFYTSPGQVNENVFAYSTRDWDDRALVFYNNSYYESSGWIRQSSPAIPQDDGSLRQDTLTEALSIHGEGRYFSLFHEQRSGLWYIRSSKDMSERGLFVSLKGYEAQVFLDIHEREDGEGSPWAQRWSRLNHELDGRGTPDPDAAAADIFLEPLYRPFTELLAPRRVQALEAALNSGDSGIVDSLLEEWMASVQDFAGAAVEYLDGAGGNYEPFVLPGAAGSWAGGGETGDGETAPAEDFARVRAWFSCFLRRLGSLKNSPAAEVLAGGGTGDAAPSTAPTAAGAGALPAGTAAYALGYGALALLRSVFEPVMSGETAAALLTHWQLDRKLRECLRGLGFNDEDVRRAVEIMKAVLCRTRAATGSGGSAPLPGGPAKGGKAGARKTKSGGAAAGVEGVEHWVAALISANYDAEDFRRLLGVNRFNEVTWFNKEALEHTLRYLSLFLLVEDEAALGPVFASAVGGSRAVFIAAFARAVLKAEEASGYRLDELIKALSEV